MDNAVVVIVGPTASGKTELAVALAHLVKAEIISADSRQIYRYLDIGTAKPSKAQLAEVRHHCIGMVDPDVPFSAGAFAREATERIHDIHSRGMRSLVVGGSGLYIHALVDGLHAIPAADHSIRKRLLERLGTEGRDALYEELMKCDPATAMRLPKENTHRLLRALEVYYVTGVPISEFRRSSRPPPPFRFLQVGIAWDREILYERINTRVLQMVRSGLLHEVKSILDRGYDPRLPALRTVGYTEAISYIRGGYDLEEMIGRIQQHTRNYAKRQLTWFRRDPRIHWHALPAGDDAMSGLARQLCAEYGLAGERAERPASS